MSKKLLQYYQSKMQTGGKVLPLYAEGNPIPSRYAPIPRATSDMRVQMPVIARTAAEARAARAFNSGTIRPAKSQNRFAKALAIVANPATAASYAVKGQRIPDNFDRAETNRYDIATSLINPFSALKQMVDTKRDLQEGNYGSAAMNAMSFLPLRRPNFGRLTSNNIYDNLGPKLSGGKNNEGVYLLRNEPDYVVKFEDPARMAWRTDTPEILNTNFADKMRDLPDDLPVSRVMYQLDDVRSPIKGNPMQRATIMNRVDGIALDDLNPAAYLQLPDESIQEMYRNIKTLRNNDLAFDFYGQNYRYNPKTRQIGMIDIGIQPVRKNYWADNVYGASNKNIYGVEGSGNNIKEAMRQMFGNDFRSMMQPTFDEIYRGEGKMLQNQLTDYMYKNTDRMQNRVQNLLRDLDPYDQGGPVDPPVRDNTYNRIKVRLTPEQLRQNRLQSQIKQIPKRDAVVQSPYTTVDGLGKSKYNKAKGEALMNTILYPADVATDFMQAGNFIPHPAAQFIGKVGNIVGSTIDAFQAGVEARKGNVGASAVNFASGLLPHYLSKYGYKRDMYNTQPGTSADRIASWGSRNGYYIPLTTRPSLANNPVVQKGLNFNRSVLGSLGAETVYDTYQDGGLLSKSVTCSNCGHSWKSVEGGIDPLTCHKCGGMVKMKDGGQHGGLDRWFAEKWVDVKSGKPCGRQEGESRAYPACRPSRRVNSGTPKTSSEMSPSEKARFKREKTSSQRISYNHKRNK